MHFSVYETYPYSLGDNGSILPWSFESTIFSNAVEVVEPSQLTVTN